MNSLHNSLTYCWQRTPKALVLAVILLSIVAAYFRLWNFSNTLMFQGDQGRDALVVSSIFRQSDPVFIGPVTSIGNMYLGPFYYYFMLPWLWLTYPNPSGPALAVAAVSILTVPLLFFASKEMVGQRAAFFAAFFYTFSQSAITYARFSWNPNLTPFFGFLMVFFTYRAWKRSPWYWVLVSVCFALLIQLHYIALLTAAGAGIIWLLQLKELLTPKIISSEIKKMVIASLISILLLFLSLTPLVLFDLKHNFINWNSFQKLFTQEKAFSPVNPSAVGTMAQWGREFVLAAQQVLINDSLTTHPLVSIIILLAITAVLALLVKNDWQKQSGLIVILSFLGTSFVGFALYQHQIYTHYYLYLIPLVCLLFGFVSARLSRSLITAAFALGLLLLFLWFNLNHISLATTNWTVADMWQTADTIYDKLSPGEKYQVLLLGPSKDLYAQNYRYFLSTKENPPLALENTSSAETLVIINEEKFEDVANLLIYEISMFPEKNNPEVYTIANGPEIVVFRRTSSNGK